MLGQRAAHITCGTLTHHIVTWALHHGYVDMRTVGVKLEHHVVIVQWEHSHCGRLMVDGWPIGGVTVFTVRSWLCVGGGDSTPVINKYWWGNYNHR